MKAVVLEDYAIQQGDLDWSGVKALVTDITRYGRTAQEEVVPRIGDAEIVFLNKCRIDEAVLAQCPKLRWVGIIATGTDNLDLKACRRRWNCWARPLASMATAALAGRPPALPRPLA